MFTYGKKLKFSTDEVKPNEVNLSLYNYDYDKARETWFQHQIKNISRSEETRNALVIIDRLRRAVD